MPSLATRCAHLPSGHLAINRVWLWAALLALNLSAWTQGLGTSSRVHADRLRRELVCVPGRLIRHAHHSVLRLPPHANHMVVAYARLRVLPDPPS